MKKRRTLIIALLLVAALALGVGYATLSTELTVTGSISNTPQAINVTYTEGSIKAGAGTAAAEAASTVTCTAGAQSATFNASGLTGEGETVSAVFTVKNYNNYDVQMDAPAILSETDADDMFTITTTWLDASGNATATAPLLEENDEATFMVTIKMDKDTANTVTADFVIKVVANSAE